MRRNVIFILFLSVFFACGRDQAIVHDLNERDANEIVVLLARNDIVARKVKEEKNQEVVWNIVVSPDDEMQARGTLVANNLPRIRHGGLEGICKDAGLILTPKTEKCREILAYKGEIINSLESIPGVVSADVVLNIPDEEEFPDENTPPKHPTASVTIQYLQDAMVKTKLTEGNVQEFVANSVSGLDARDVTVIISFFKQKIEGAGGDDGVAAEKVPGTSVETPGSLTPLGPGGEVVSAVPNLVSIGGIFMDEVSAKRFKVIAAVFLLTVLLLAAGFIFALYKMSQLRKQSPVTAIATKPAGGESGQKMLEAQNQ